MGSIPNMANVSSTSVNKVLDLEAISSPPPYLGRLALGGRLQKLPEWLTRLENLVMIRLQFSMLEVDPLESLRTCTIFLSFS
ncbi:hypothetical protein L484_023731 [Morus notabilis]|uniref:Disease resistance protein RPM1 n=1 Tax=Morus notabilis TaxID=981085 RepID=W9R148_9ROSA|nr:hypothetical protein L484_023731 [Morus notabilis]